MTLSAGTRLGSYEIVGPLGAGGMGSACGPREALAAEREHAGVGPRGHREQPTEPMP